MDRSSPIRKTSGWRSTTPKPRRNWMPALRFALAVPLLALVYGIAANSTWTTASPSPTKPQPTAVAAPPAAPKTPRLVYQYSVVPGGVQDVAELSSAVAHDPDVALHYASFNFRRAHLVRLPASQKMYISYRRHGHILWTKTPHLILAGEKVITDGKVTARVRCGNRLASKPQGLTAPDEPSEAELSQPVAVAGDPVRPPAILANHSSLEPPLVANGPSAPGPAGFPPGGIGPPIGGGGGTPCETEAQEAAEHDHDKGESICGGGHHPPPPAVPEPSTVLLVGSGLLLLGYQFRARRLQ